MRGGKIGNKGIFEDPSYAEKRSQAPKPAQPEVNNLVNEAKESNPPSESHPSLYKAQLNPTTFDRKPKSVATGA